MVKVRTENGSVLVCPLMKGGNLQTFIKGDRVRGVNKSNNLPWSGRVVRVLDWNC